MSWSERDQQVWDSIKAWKRDLYDYEANDLEFTYVKWLDTAFGAVPEEVQESFFQRLDGWLFQLHSLIQGSQMQNDAKERILSTARTFNPDIQVVDDLAVLSIDQLHYIAEQHAGRHRFYSLVQGGITGTGGLVALGSDLPAMAVINLRSIQLIAASYGCDVQAPFETMTSLKVFHAATLPARLQAETWDDLLQDLESKGATYFFDGSEQLTDYTWLEGTLKQSMKALAISMFKGKKWSGLPLISMAIGAGSNYQLSRRITAFAEKYYQYRYLREKKS
ncbi:EcsC family protein [Rossellomorea sp. RS05]|uniref:EcsC family protein n=1 Tax=Rossellomorea sp. RS05 TaxID=3149166 RepID=UPI0032216DAE